MAFNDDKNSFLKEGDIVDIERLGEREVLDTGGAIPETFNVFDLPDHAWLDHYIGIQPPGVFYTAPGKREVRLKR